MRSHRARRAASRRPVHATPCSRGNRRGAALIEIMVAMTVMVIALTGLAGMTVSAGHRSTVLAATGGRTAVQTEVLEQLMTVPYNVLPSKAGCTSASALPYAHRRCVTVTDVSFRRRQVRVVFTPTNRLLRVDTLVFERSKGVSNSPLN